MTATALDLNAYCGRSKPHFRYDLSRPFVQGGHLYATDTIIAVRLRDESPDTPVGAQKFPPIQSHPLWSQFPLNRAAELAVDLPPVKTDKCMSCSQAKCPECEGLGEVEWDGPHSYHTYSAECRFCHGFGSVSHETVKRLRLPVIEAEPSTAFDKCDGCGGSGIVTVDNGQTEAAGVLVANKYLRKILSLPSIAVQPSKTFNIYGQPDALLFEAEGGIEGVIVARRPC